MRRMRSLSVSPSTYSRTMYGRPSSSPASMTCTMWRLESPGAGLASRPERSGWAAAEPQLRRLQAEFGGEVPITFVLAGPARLDDGPALAADALDAAAASGMPV